MSASREDTPFLEYVGQDGYSQPCVDAVMRLLLPGHRFEEAIIVTHNRTEHAFVLYEFGEPHFVVHSGFTSDSGEGLLPLLDARTVLYKTYLSSTTP